MIINNSNIYNYKDIENNFMNALLDFDKIKAEEILSSLMLQVNQFDIINQILINVLKNIGESWEKGDLALSQIYMSGSICDELITKILPASSNKFQITSKIAIVTLSDYHILGKKIVCSVLRASGFEIKDYGHGITVNDLVKWVIEDKIEILLISTLMYPAALKIKEVRETLLKNNIHIKILVGGAPFIFDDQLWSMVGADAYGKSPKDAIEILSRWTGRI